MSARPTSLRSTRTLLLRLVLGALLPGALGTSALLWMMHQRNVEAFESSVEQTAQALAQAVDNRLAQARLLAQMLADSTALAAGDLHGFRQEALAALELPEVVNNVTLADRTGQQLLNTLVPLGQALPRAANLVAIERALATNAPVVGDIVTSPTLRRPLVCLAIPATVGSARMAVLVGILPMQFERLLTGQTLPGRRSAAVLDRLGNVVAVSRSDSPLRLVAPSTAFLQAIQGAEHGVVRRAPLDGAEFTAGYARAGATGWSVVVGEPAAELSATLRQSIAWLLVSAVALVSLSVFVTRRIAGALLGEHEHLVSAAKSLGDGGTVSGPRPGLLETASVFDAMERASRTLAQRDALLREEMARTGRLNEALAAHRRDLESTVAQRTAQLEAALHAAQSANRAKSAFLANISHEIRTPLNAILGMTHLLVRGTSDPVKRDRLEKVQNAAQHLLGILNDVLDLSKIEAGRLELQAAEFEVSDVLAKARELVAEQASRKGLALHVDAGDAPPRLVGDATRLCQALMNLVSNAVKFTQTGSVTVRVRSDVLRHDEALLRFEVTDTGPGLSAEARRRLFRPFQQADDSSTRRHGGTGLGLALTRELATVMGGDVGVDSTEGAGSTFWFTAKLKLPRETTGDESGLAGGTDQAVSPEMALRLRHAGRRVLVAEDNLVNQEVATELLSAVGLVAVRAHDGEEAARRALDEPFDAVLMDVQMPNVDGLEAARRIRAAGCATPIIAVTASAFANDRAACLAAGMNDHLAKPVAPEILYASLLRWLSGPEPFGPAA